MEKPERARLFVALDLPEPERSGIAAWRDELVEGRSDLRPVRADALHVTLAFLGWQEAAEAPAIAEAAFGGLPGLSAPVLRAAGVKPIPPRGGPRLFALDLEDPEGACLAVQQAVAGGLVDFYEPEKRAFWPHVTLARVKKGVRRAAPLEGPPLSSEPFSAGEVVLYRSILRPDGARYEPQAKRAL